MIATILPSSSNFHAVSYNLHKVAEGKAELIVMKNFGSLEVFGYKTPQQLQDYLKEYSSRNSRIKKPQFHVAISCRGNEWSIEELKEFADEYLREMGYDDPDQPTLIFAHHDTENNHIHIVTSRVAPNGKKINDSKERLKSQKAIEKILKMNVEKKAEEDIRTALSFKYSSMREFKSILEAMGYGVFESKKVPGTLYVKKGGKVRTKISIDKIKAGFSESQKLDKAERMKWRSIFMRTKETCVNMSSFVKKIRKQLGVQAVFYGPKDKPAGFHLVDFAHKRVIWGEPVIGLKSLMDFRPLTERIKEVEVIIDRLLRQFPYLTTKEINRHLRPISSGIIKGYYWYHNHNAKLEDRLYNTIRRNDKIAWLNSFRFANEQERAAICELVKFNVSDIIKIVPCDESNYKAVEVAALNSIIGEPDKEERLSRFQEAGYGVYVTETGTYIINMKKHVIIDAKKAGISREIIDSLRPTRKGSRTGQITEQTGKSIRPSSAIPSHVSGQNREWEVGKRDWDKDDLDRQQGVGY